MSKNKKKLQLSVTPRVTLGQKLAQEAGAPIPKSNKHLVTDKATLDSFSNLTSKLGIQQPDSNLISNSYYELGPFISRNRLELEAMYRSSWIVGQVVDTVAEDMTREGISMYSEMSPDDVTDFQTMLDEFQVWHDICSTIKWARLYGGAIAVMLIDGADYSKPLDIERIRKDQFKGLVVLDRWMIQPSMGELITDICKDIGKPKYYEVLSGVSTFPEQKIHYTRVMRFDGIELPYYQSLFENLWGISVIERMFDRLVAFDSATVGAAQLVYKAHLRVILIDKFREALAAGGDQERAVIKNIEYIRALQSSEGITALDGMDKFETHSYNFSGLSDMLQQFGQQISGSTGIPLVRLFGQSPAGLNATGESDLRNYYDHINKEQTNKLKPQLEKLFAVMAKSKFGRALPDDFSFEFNPLWQLSELEKSQIAAQDTNQIAAAYGGGLYSKPLALKELKQQSRVTGRGTNITSEDIEEAEKEEQAPSIEEILAGANPEGGIPGNGETPLPEDENDRLGGQNPDMLEEKKEKPKIEKEVKDSVRKTRFMDRLKKAYLVLKEN